MVAKLDHWDFVDSFSIYDLAALISGDDPDLTVRKRYAYERHLFVPSGLLQRIESEARKARRKIADLDNAFDFVDIPSLRSVKIDSPNELGLRSELALRALAAVQLGEPEFQGFIGKSPIYKLYDDESDPLEFMSFSRTEILRWLEETGLRSIYDFAVVKKVRRVNTGISGVLGIEGESGLASDCPSPKTRRSHLLIIGALARQQGISVPFQREN